MNNFKGNFTVCEFMQLCEKQQTLLCRPLTGPLSRGCAPGEGCRASLNTVPFPGSCRLPPGAILFPRCIYPFIVRILFTHCEVLGRFYFFHLPELFEYSPVYYW